MPALVHCIYSSVEAVPFTEAELARLIDESRERNLQHNVTGILLHVNDSFFQILEGSREVVEDLYGKILNDPRHTRITQIIFETIPRRYFSDSSMTLATMSPAELATMIDEDNLEHREEVLAGLDEGRAKRLLRAFTDGRWRNHVRTPQASAASVSL